MGTEIIKENRGGYREGSGQPKGTKSEKTLLKEQIRAEMHQRVFKVSQKILSAQMVVAIGTHKMIQIMKGPGDTVVTRTIRDTDEMQKLLDEGVYGVDYIVLIGKEPDWKAGESILNRTFGKAKETIDINATVENINVDDKEKGDKAIIDYLSGKRGVTVQTQKPLRADELTYKNN